MAAALDLLEVQPLLDPTLVDAMLQGQRVQTWRREFNAAMEADLREMQASVLRSNAPGGRLASLCFSNVGREFATLCASDRSDVVTSVSNHPSHSFERGSLGRCDTTRPRRC